ncbi:MAG: hypothetical protein ACMUJM_23775 [bacterium]
MIQRKKRILAPIIIILVWSAFPLAAQSPSKTPFMGSVPGGGNLAMVPNPGALDTLQGGNMGLLTTVPGAAALVNPLLPMNTTALVNSIPHPITANPLSMAGSPQLEISIQDPLMIMNPPVTIPSTMTPAVKGIVPALNMNTPMAGVLPQAALIQNQIMRMSLPVADISLPVMAMQDQRARIPLPGIGMQNTISRMSSPVMGLQSPLMNMSPLTMGMQSPSMNMSPLNMGIQNQIMSMSMPTPLLMIGMTQPLPATPSLSPSSPQILSPPPPATTTAAVSGILAPPGPPAGGGGAGGSCVFCHSDLQTMTDLGFPQFYFDPVLVRAETGMPARCDDCHLGNPTDFTQEGAHAGVLGLLVMRNQYRDINRRKDVIGIEYELIKSIQSIRQSNTNDPRYRLSVSSPFHMLLWHDRNVTTASWNPDISMQTCGRCHPTQVAEFNTTEMGLVQNMSQYIPWIVPPVPGGLGTHLTVAPQSCGLWTAATIPPNNDAFTDDNRLLYNSTSTSIANQFLDPLFPQTSTDPLTGLQSLANQRNCNKCHPSCLDCHYVPFEENIPAAMGPGVKPAGTHTVTRRPLVMNCMGIGRGQFCHGGATERRRGDGFIKGAFAHIPPVELRTIETQAYLDSPDIHYNGDFNPPNATCVDCHGPLPGIGGGPPPIHGDMNRNPEPGRCGVCHPAVVNAYLAGTHRNLTCGACHTPKIVGYGFNFWAPGTRFGITPNPLDRHSRYAVNAMTPLLLVDEQGMWAPYHPQPHISTHIDPLYLLVENFLSPRILWRNQPDIGIVRQHPSKDGVAITGSYNGELYGRDEGQVMVWLNIDKIAHSITSRLSVLPPRTCIECHTPNGIQRITASFAWNDNPALMYEALFAGSYDIVADAAGLRIENLASAPPSLTLEPMRGKWSVPGFYIIPPATGPAIGHPSGIP